MIPWGNPASSYLLPWERITEVEMMEKEKQLYTEGIRRRLFDMYDYPVTGDELESTYFDFDGDGNVSKDEFATGYAVVNEIAGSLFNAAGGNGGGPGGPPAGR